MVRDIWFVMSCSVLCFSSACDRQFESADERCSPGTLECECLPDATCRYDDLVCQEGRCRFSESDDSVELIDMGSVDSEPVETLPEDDDSNGDSPSKGRLPKTKDIDHEVPYDEPMGMTWGVREVYDALGATRLSCYGFPKENGETACDPYSGNTPCSEARPLLCLRVDGTPRPPYEVWDRIDQFGWANGEVDYTDPIIGNEISSWSHADEICEQQLGKGFRMAEFHDGRYVSGMDEDRFFGDTWPDETSRGQWAFAGAGIIEPNHRLWVAIDDQYANCWN